MNVPNPPSSTQRNPLGLRNFASADCSARVVGVSGEAKKQWSVLVEKEDEYLLRPCKTPLWIVVQLCEQINVRMFELGNLELFSSSFKDFIIYGSKYPSSNWEPLGKFAANDTRTVQRFSIHKPDVWIRDIKIVFLTYYGDEYYCPLSIIRVYGVTMVEDVQMNLEPPRHSSKYVHSIDNVPFTSFPLQEKEDHFPNSTEICSIGNHLDYASFVETTNIILNVSKDYTYNENVFKLIINNLAQMDSRQFQIFSKLQALTINTKDSKI